jgi:hypothetical protein|tara:strand:+ start:430 stop:807 length:378 start_codon:yes stop_codon:yes gene_type:complete
MNWQDTLRKMPFSAREKIEEGWKQLPSHRRDHQKLETLLEEKLDKDITQQLRYKGKSNFSVPVDNKLHDELVRLVGGEEELKTRMKILYSLTDFSIDKKGSRPVFDRRLGRPSTTLDNITYNFKV